MRLNRLSLFQFKNYESAEIRPERRFVCVTGQNGAGKTNILEAIYYLSFCRTARSTVEDHNLMHGADGFRVSGEFSRKKAETTQNLDIIIKYRKKGGKQILSAGEPYSKLADHIGKIPLVFIGPEDLALLDGYSEGRRKFLDTTLCQTHRNYLDALIIYNRFLKQRNALLKSFKEGRTYDKALLDTYTPGMQQAAETIFSVRNSFMEVFMPVFELTYAKLSGEKEQPELCYKSGLKKASLSELFAKSLRSDEFLGRTTEGVHKDDLECLLDAHEVKKTGSQGQKKTYLIALKLAVWVWLSENTGCAPLLLLDDIFDKLDRNRVKALFDLLADAKYGQVFITDTNAKRVEEVFSSLNLEFQHIMIKDGIVSN
ncbi:MAG: DNA replication and repair protein RecF [Limisphaerales bacterium]|jgi:DNA replication and repair protein RecF